MSCCHFVVLAMEVAARNAIAEPKVVVHHCDKVGERRYAWFSRLQCAEVTLHTLKARERKSITHNVNLTYFYLIMIISLF